MLPTLSKYSNIFKSFRNTDPFILSSSSLFHKKWDQPTFLTFSVFFRMENIDAVYTGYDRFPMPLLNTYIQDSYFSSDVNGAVQNRNQYSTLNYLRDTDEFVRAELLSRFIEGINHLQSYYQWYFQSIDGLQSLLQVNPTRGRRLAADAKLSFKMLDGLDQKVFNLLNTYKKIAWDDTWQRWILPDMMRYFAMDIYITEFRTFHTPSVSSTTSAGAVDLILKALHNTMPTWKITCERCEFDITSINKHATSYNVNADPQEQVIDFDIKIGQIQEEYINPILDYYYNDKLVNGLSRTREFVSKASQTPDQDTETAQGAVSVNSGKGPDYDPTRVSTNPHAYANTQMLATGQLLIKNDHISGRPFIENANALNSIKQTFGTIGTPTSGSLSPNFDPVRPETWVGNAVNLGTAFASNFAKTYIDKGKMTKIPGLGISFNETLAAIESKNISTVYGLVRQSIDKSFRAAAEAAAKSSSLLGKVPLQKNLETDVPSSLLDDAIDSTFKQFLSGISNSEATDKNIIELKQYADLALADAGTFDRIKDLSRATDLVSVLLKEVNDPNPIENPRTYSNLIEQQLQGDKSFATDSGNAPIFYSAPLIIEGIPSSQATNNRIVRQ